MPLTLPEFVARWQGSTLTERSASQSHFIQLCEVLRQPSPAEVDMQGTHYTFERGAARLGQPDGWADVWLRGHFGWEYKGPRLNLAAAYQQLLQYREDLENPPLLVVSDMDRFEVHTNFYNTVKQVYVFRLADLLTNDRVPGSDLTALQVLEAVFTDYNRLRPGRTTADVTRQAAIEFAELAQALSDRGHDPQAVAHFLMRLLFCLFAEDINLLPERIFSRLLELRRNPAQFDGQLSQLFATMSRGRVFGVTPIPYVDGGLFDDATTIEMVRAELDVLYRAANLDWSSIEPATFGTLFTRSLDPDRRAQLGAEYTSREDIERVIEPVVMAALRRRWGAVTEQAERKLDEWRAAQTANDRAMQTRRQNELANEWC